MGRTGEEPPSHSNHPPPRPAELPHLQQAETPSSLLFRVRSRCISCTFLFSAGCRQRPLPWDTENAKGIGDGVPQTKGSVRHAHTEFTHALQRQFIEFLLCARCWATLGQYQWTRQAQPFSFRHQLIERQPRCESQGRLLEP